MKVENNAPLTIGEGLNKQHLTRRFLGQAETWKIKDKAERRHQQKNLRAYLKGWSRFGNEWNAVLGAYTAPHITDQEYFYK